MSNNGSDGQPGPPAAVPALLLPVRVETRFVDQPGGSELWVRVIPDQIWHDSHDPRLTQGERADGQAYWTALWRAGQPPQNPDAPRAAWRRLVLGHGVPRAAWIALQLTPQNPNDQPTLATRADQPLPVTPVFPAREERDDSWARPPLAQFLPDHWSVVTISDGVASPAVRGGPVRSPLPLGPDPGVEQPPDEQLGVVDAGMRWMVDFPAAEAAGMGIRVPVSPAARARGFDRILVYGLRSQDDGAAQLATLLDHHHYSDGLSLIPQGAPTNNTPDAVAFSPQEDSADGSFLVERGQPLATDPVRDGAVAAQLLGLPAGVVDHVRGADGLDQQDARHMAVALWPATAGYLLGTMLAPATEPEGVEAARGWVLDTLRARGPLPALAVGATPYGILPVTSLRLWQLGLPGDGPDALLAFLARALPLWQASAATSPRIRPDSVDPDSDLVRILGMEASSRSFRARPVYGDQYWWMRLVWARFQQQPMRRWWDAAHQPGRDLLTYFGASEWSPRITRTSLGPDSATQPITRPLVLPHLVDGNEPLSETQLLPADTPLADGTSGTYLDWLRQATVDQLRHDRDQYPGQRPESLLYRLLRQSLLTEYYQQAASGQPPPDNGPNLFPTARRPLVGVEEPEHVGFPSRPTKTPWDTLDEDVPGHPGIAWKDYLYDDPAPVGSPFQHLGELRASLAHLAGRATAELERLLTETLDAFGYRLDAWMTAIATGRLMGLRAAQAQDSPVGSGGLVLGGYGWVEDLRPAAPQPLDPTEHAAVALQLGAAWQAAGFDPATPVYQPPPDNGGFIYAPSPQQAMTAAVLRNGYLAHRQATNGKLLAIDLSARRMRQARWLLAEANTGRPVGALLGYRFEQALQRSGLDRYQQPFRHRYPLADQHGSAGQPDQPTPEPVTDGYALWTAWRAGQLPPGGAWGNGLPGPGPDQDTISMLLVKLDDLVDALNDLSVAEAVHQLSVGNPARAGSILDALSKGHRVPDPQVLDVQQERLTYHQRILLILTGDGVVGNGWQQATVHPRATAEPRLTAWLSHQLPNPAQVRGYVTYTDHQGQRQRVPVQLDDLDLGPLDFLALAPQVGLSAQDGELERRLCNQPAVPADATDVAADFTLDPTGGDADQLSFPQAAFVAQTLQDLLRISQPTTSATAAQTAEHRQAGAGTLSPADLIAPNLDPAVFGGQLDVADLTGRATTARKTLGHLLDQLTLDADHADPATLRQSLLAASYLGLPSAIPATTTEAGPPLTVRTATTIEVLSKRHRDVNDIDLSDPAASPAELANRARQVLATVFDQTAPVLPRCTPPAIDQLRAAFAASNALIDPDRQAPERWLQQLTHVRPALARLDLARTATHLVGAPRLPLTLAQLPYQPGDRWLALPLPDPSPATGGVPAGQLSLVALLDGDYQQDSSWAGLVIDAWDEAIPAPTGSAGLAFHYQLPSHAPQALLLAVTPDHRPVWDDEALQAILTETLDLLRVRTVDLDTLPTPPQAPVAIGQICPALYLPYNAAGDAISADLTGS